MQTSQPVTVNTVLIDDSDPNVQYSTGWVNKPSLLAQSDPNYPRYGTLHETVNQTDLTYSFSGSSILACAQVAGNLTSLINVDSLWICFVDRVQIGTSILIEPPSIHLPSTLCCLVDGKANGLSLNAQVQHEIHITATGSQDHQILFDYLTYETSLAVSVADLIIYTDDPAFRKIEGWEAQDDGRIVTTEPKANLTFDFYGSSVLWFGFYNTTSPGYASSAGFSWFVDSTTGGEGLLDPSAAKQALDGSSDVEYLLFQTFALPRGQHRLEVSYTVSGVDPIPLTLTHLVVQNSSTINPNSSVPTTTPTPSAAPNARSNGARRPHLAIILGCCGVAILVLLILGIFCARRRMKRRDRASGEIGTSSLIEPFNSDPASAPVGTHQKGQPPSGEQEQVVVETAEIQVEAPPSYITGPLDS